MNSDLLVRYIQIQRPKLFHALDIAIDELRQLQGDMAEIDPETMLIRLDDVYDQVKIVRDILCQIEGYRSADADHRDGDIL